MPLIISAGSGATVATEQIASLHYGWNKIADGTSGATVGWMIDGGANASGAGHVFLRGNVTLSGNVTISDSKSFIGLVSVSGFANPMPVSGTFFQTTQPVSWSGNVTLSDPKTFIGSVSVGGLVDSKGFIGLVTTQAADSKGYIGLTTVTPGTSWPDPKTYIGLVTVGGIGTVTLADPKGFIGLVTVGGNLVKDVFGSATTFTITLASLANSTAGVGRQSTTVTSNTAKSAIIACKITVGTTPTANSLIYVYLLRGDGTITDDNAGATDAGITIVNAPLLGTILCSAATSNVAYYGVFDTKFLGSLGPTFGIAVVNSTGVALNATGGNHSAEYTLIT